MKFKIEYGCYLGTDEEIVEADSLAEAENMAYELAIEATDGWLGMHGFTCECSVESDDGWHLTQTGGDCCRETIENAADYSAELYSDEEEE